MSDDAMRAALWAIAEALGARAEAEDRLLAARHAAQQAVRLQAGERRTYDLGGGLVFEVTADYEGVYHFRPVPGG